MAFSPVKFCGLSVIGLRSSLGAGTGARLQVDLVADDDDVPAVPAPGTPVFAQVGSYTFGGLLQRFETSTDGRGGTTHTAYCVDPREVLGNASVVVGNYGGFVNVPNLINVYGSLEARGGFGASGAGESGMDWVRVRTELLALTSQPAGAYGGPLEYRGHSYSVDLTGVPNPPLGYQVGPVVVNLLDLIDSVVQDTGRDWYCELVGFTVRVRTVDRSIQQPLGLVQALVESYRDTGTLVRGSYGSEDASGAISSAFLMGGERADLYLADGLKNFWGYRPDGTAVVGETGYQLYAARWKLAYPEGSEERRKAHLPPPRVAKEEPDPELVGNAGVPATPTTPAVPATPADYPALVTPGDYMEWEEVSAGHEVARLNALPVADVIAAVEYECSTFEMRLALAGIDPWSEFVRNARPDVDRRLHGLAEALPQLQGVLHNVDFVPDGVKRAVADALAVAEQGANSLRERLHQFVRGYAEEFYGVQWLVPLPDVASKLDPETLDVTYSVEPTSAGWAEEGSGPLGLAPVNEDLFADPQGRFPPFVSFDASGADLAEAGGTEGSVFQGTTYYTKAQLTPGLVFLNETPHALVRTDPFSDVNADAVGGLEEVASLFFRRGVDFIQSFFSLDYAARVAPARRTPLGAAVPLRGTTQTYGPWFKTVGAGRVDARQDASFTPWNFGGTARMNLAASAAIDAAVSAAAQADSGLVEVVGLPLVSLNEALEGGPLVTDISIEYGVRGVQTTYRWGTYTPRPGGTSRQLIEKIRRNGTLGQEIRRTMRAAARDAMRSGEQARKGRAARRFDDGLVKALKKQTPHDTLVATATRDHDGRVRHQVQALTAREAVPYLRPDDETVFRQRAGVSWNGLLRPVSTGSGGCAATGILSCYPDPTGVPFGLTARTLNPYASGCDVDFVAWGDRYSGVRAFRAGFDPQNARVLAHKAPLVLTGWGRDVYGNQTNPPPSGMARPDEWKTGPLDPLWDPDRGAWSVHDAAIGIAPGGLPAGGSGTLALWDGRNALGKSLTVWDWSNAGVGSGTRVMAIYEPRSDRWYATPSPSGVSVSSGGGGASGFFARLTSTSGGSAWNFYRVKFNGSAYVDDGAEVTGYVARNLTLGAVATTPAVGDRVWMTPSQTSSYYEFLPIGVASVSSIGVVTTASQTFGGTKYFDAGVVASGDIITAAGYSLICSEKALLHETIEVASTCHLAHNNGFVRCGAAIPSTGDAMIEFTPDGGVTSIGGSRYSGLVWNWVGNSASGTMSQAATVETGYPGIGGTLMSFSNAGFAEGWLGVGDGIVIRGSLSHLTGGVGIWGTRTVKDGSGTNQTVTIKGGVITDWTT